MSHGRGGHVAVLLSTGEVLVAGGQPADGSPPLTSAEIYDPVSATWRSTTDLNTGRFAASAVLLMDGRVLVAGGFGPALQPLTTAEIYTP